MIDITKYPRKAELRQAVDEALNDLEKEQFSEESLAELKKAIQELEEYSRSIGSIEL